MTLDRLGSIRIRFTAHIDAPNAPRFGASAFEEAGGGGQGQADGVFGGGGEGEAELTQAGGVFTFGDAIEMF